MIDTILKNLYDAKVYLHQEQSKLLEETHFSIFATIQNDIEAAIMAVYASELKAIDAQIKVIEKVKEYNNVRT